jgi:hypothetical protein
MFKFNTVRGIRIFPLNNAEKLVESLVMAQLAPVVEEDNILVMGHCPDDVLNMAKCAEVKVIHALVI